MSEVNIKPNCSVILCTCPEAVTAEKLARGMVEKGLAACANIIPNVTSIYTWDGEVVTAGEAQLIIKTSDTKIEALNQWLTEAHPYDTPEIIALPIESGNENYLSWVIEQTK